jgi:hypothetical protein
LEQALNQALLQGPNKLDWQQITCGGELKKKSETFNQSAMLKKIL